jgi:hypothetical protein
MPTLTKYIYATMVNLNGGGHHTVTKTETLRTVLVEGHGDDPGVMVMTLLSHSMTFPILSPYKFADVAENLILMTLSRPFSLRLA